MHPLLLPRACGATLGPGTLRAQPEDFVVEEELGFAPSGSGQHLLLRVRKRAANTRWIAGELAKLAGCRTADVGYAGMKDRHAVATQWFSIPRAPGSPRDWREARGADFEVLEAHIHSRKLPRGALAGNRFSVRVRDTTVAEDVLATRLAEIRERGVPNYFGPQRFGREGANLARINAGLRALRPRERGFVLSAARSLVFNAILAVRVEAGTWERLQAGDVANLDGRGSVFPVDVPETSLVERCARLEIHPTGALWGQGAPASRGAVRELEARCAGELPEACRLLEEASLEQERRSLRLPVRDLEWQRDEDGWLIQFRLARGGFATVVLREVFDIADSDQIESST
ncbi:MAG TPA: tRNA pseudouridine(13) synthase TruD [Steroidobacteraceae bacterium]|nr:tRNA pseudouridine(13) synthase TruD [Steroidobacteraceae bacterium]